MSIDDFLNVLSSKYNYDEQLISLFKSIVPAMIQYFGKEYEEKILKAFLETPIGFVKTPEDVQKFANSRGVKGTYRMPLVASAGYENYFQLNDNNQIEEIPFIIIREGRINNEYLNTVVHELCHMVMNYQKSQIIDNKVFTPIGMAKNEIEFVNGQPVVKSEGMNFEEGLNEFDARSITKSITGEEVQNGAYGTYYNYVSVLMNDDEYRKIVDQSRLNGDDSWKDILGTELSNEYVNALEEYSKALFDRSIPRDQRKILKAAKEDEMIRLMGIVKDIVQKKELNNTKSM